MATKGEKVIQFIELICRVPEGNLLGQPIKLLPFQKKFILAIYDNPNCQTRQAYLSIARKNGKSALIACLVLAHLVGPVAIQNSQIISGARSREQASIIFRLARKIIMFSSILRAAIKVTPSHKQLFGLAMNTEYQALSAESTTAHGLSPILAILDEVGQVRGPQDDFIDAITTSQGAHDNPLLIAISTQAPTDADLFSIWLDDAELSGDKSIVSHVYTSDPECELNDEAQWAKSNPAMGIFRSVEDIRDQASKAGRMGSAENTFRVLTLNQRVNPYFPFVSNTTWKLGNDYPEPFGSHLVYAGLDLSSTTDLTAFVMVCDIDGILHVRSYFWMPRDTVEDAAKRDRAGYVDWVKKGYIRTTPGKAIDYDYVAKDIIDIVSDVNIARICFDRWRMDRLKGSFERLGIVLPLESFGQGFVSMSPAIDTLEGYLIQGNVRHGNNPPLTMCASNAIVVKDPAGNRKLDKSKSTGRIDGMVSLVMAAGGLSMKAVEAEPEYQMMVL